MNHIEIAKIFANEQIEKESSITAAIVTGSAARGDVVETSDINILLLLDRSADSSLRHKKIQVWQEDIFIDAEYVSGAKYTNSAMMLKDPYLAGVIREAVVLFDRDGTFTKAQQVVREQFMEPRWLQARLSSIVPGIKRKQRELIPAIEQRDEVGICCTIIFTLWDICDLLLVKQGISPTWVRGLQRLGDTLPAERDRIIIIEGTAAMTPDDVTKFIPLVKQVNDAWNSSFWRDILRKIEWMNHHNLHPEAFHSLWISFALSLRELMGVDENEKRQHARISAHTWLEKMHWDEHTITEKNRHLSEYVARTLFKAI